MLPGVLKEEVSINIIAPGGGRMFYVISVPLAFFHASGKHRHPSAVL
jgi:hypothetical protein